MSGRRAVAAAIPPVGDRGRDGRIVVHDEIAPDLHEGAREVRALVRGRRTKVPADICTVLGGGDGILVFVGFAAFVGVGLGDPVARTDESRLGVHVVGTLLLACSELAFVEGGGTCVAVCCEGGSAGNDGIVRTGVVEKDFGDVVVGEEGKDELEPGDEIGFGGDVLNCECGAFVGVVAGKHAHPVDLLL